MNEPASGLSACAGSLGAARPSKARDASNEKRVEWGGGEGSLSLDSFIHVHRLVRLRVFFLLSFRLVDWCLFAFGEEQAFVAQKVRVVELAVGVVMVGVTPRVYAVTRPPEKPQSLPSSYVPCRKAGSQVV